MHVTSGETYIINCINYVWSSLFWQDEKFERLFKRYADKVKLGIESLVFMFDGDKINLTATPDSLGMDDEDIIEVLAKKSWLTCPLMKFWYVIVSYQYFCLG